MSKHNSLEAIRRANAKESYEWLAANSSDHFEAVNEAVEQGVSPDDIYWTVYRDTFRHELAHRCKLAARHAVGLQVSTLERYGLKE